MSIAELKASIAAGRARRRPGHSQQYTIQQKFSIPAASLVLALIGLALGVSHRKDGRFSSFVLGFGVIFAYYVVLWTVRAGALTGQLPAGPGARGFRMRSSASRAWRCCSGGPVLPTSRFASAFRSFWRAHRARAPRSVMPDRPRARSTGSCWSSGSRT